MDYEKSINCKNIEIEKVPESYQWAVNYRTNINNHKDLEEVMKIIEYSYKSTM